PDRLQERISEAEIENVHDRFLAEEVVDPEYRIFREHRLCDAIELPRGGQVATERLLDDHARMVGQAGGAQPFDYGCKERRRDGEVVRRSLGIFQRLLERLERTQGFVIAVHV